MRETSMRRHPDRKIHRGDWKHGARTAFQDAVPPTEIPEGKAWCEDCRQVVPLRKDGTVRAHRTRSKVPCIGATARIGGRKR